jgi:hypothetical protein
MLLNTSAALQTGRIRVFRDNAMSAATFEYSMPAGSTYLFETDGSSSQLSSGWMEVTPALGSTSPVAAGVIRFKQGGIVVTESGVPPASLTTRARTYVDRSNGHDTGLALASPARANITVQAFRTDGRSPIGIPQTVVLAPNGHIAGFAGQMIPDLPDGFTGVIEISSDTPFAALALRSLVNARGDFLITALPIADVHQPAPAPVVFPQIADGGGFRTEIILISPASGAAATLACFSSDGTPLPILQ